MAEIFYPQTPVLLVDDEPEILQAAEIALAVGGITNVITCVDSTRVKDIVATGSFSTIILDLMMPKVGGAELLDVLRPELNGTPVIIVTGMVDVETAVELMKKGAHDYLVKPVDAHRLVSTVRMAIEHQEIQKENELLRSHLLSGDLSNPTAFDHILTADRKMQGIFGYVEAIAPTSLPVLITGETGVGKELLAEALHNASGRSGEFIAVNTAGLDDQLFSDTLFGHVRGAYTGSSADRRGVISRASGGTLFLDEIGDLAPESQIKLLRLAQQREYYPLGSDNVSRTDARFVFATNRNLEEMVKNGEFRVDLYYRLHSHRVSLPPLRERPEDIPLLTDFFLAKAAEETGKSKPSVPPELFTYLRLYSFPGNIRELQGQVFDAMVRHTGGVLSLDSFRVAIDENVPVKTLSRSVSPGGSLFGSISQLPMLADVTAELIQEAMVRAGGNQTAAASILGMTRTALNKRLNRASSSGE